MHRAIDPSRAHRLILTAEETECPDCKGSLVISQHRKRYVQRLTELVHQQCRDKSCPRQECVGTNRLRELGASVEQRAERVRKLARQWDKEAPPAVPAPGSSEAVGAALGERPTRAGGGAAAPGPGWRDFSRRHPR